MSTPIHRLVNIVGNRMRHVSVQRMSSCVETVLTTFGNAKIRPEGGVKLLVVNPNTSEARMLDFYVTRASEIAILRCKACAELELVRRVSVDTVAENDVLPEAKMRAHYSDVFTGLGKYEKKIPH